MARYADGPTASVAIEIDAPPSAVWPHLIDIDTPARFSSEFQGATWQTPEGARLGATFEGRNRHQAVGEWRTVSTITAIEEARVFEWTVGDPDDKAARWRFDLEPVGDGSRLTFSAEMGPGPSGLSVAIEAMPDREEDIVARRLAEWRRNMTLTLEGIKDLVEQG